jgi:hypothetical protein
VAGAAETNGTFLLNRRMELRPQSWYIMASQHALDTILAIDYSC